MESLRGDAAETENFDREPRNENVNWVEVVDNMINKFTDKNMEVTYDFENLQINLPEAKGPEGMLIGSAKCEINGKFTISTRLHDN